MMRDYVHPNNDGATVMVKTAFRALTKNEYTGTLPLVSAEKKTP